LIGSALALGSGGIVFLLTTLLIYTALSIICGTLGHSVPWIWLAALGLTAGLFGLGMKAWRGGVELQVCVSQGSR